MTADPIPEGLAILTDVDWAGGLICDPCYYRGWPPRYDYLREVLRGTPLRAEDILEAIAKYAYPDYEENA